MNALRNIGQVKVARSLLDRYLVIVARRHLATVEGQTSLVELVEEVRLYWARDDVGVKVKKGQQGARASFLSPDHDTVG